MPDIARRVSQAALALAGGAPGLSAFATGHPVLGAVLLVVGETVTAVGVFAGKLADDVAGQLRERWRDRIVDWIDQKVGGGGRHFDRVYRKWLLSEVNHMNQKGLSTRPEFTPKLDELYIDLSLDPRPVHKIDKNLVPEPSLDDKPRHKIWHFLAGKEPHVLVIVGVPGSGKTTLLNHIASKVCRGHGRRGRTVPILLFLRDHVKQIKNNPQVALYELVTDTISRYGLLAPPNFFDKRLTQGRCLVLFDGLDEVANEDDRRAVAAWIDLNIRRHGDNDFVVTSRPQGYRSAEITRRPNVLQVRGFTNEQVVQFIRQWYEAVENRETDADQETRERRASRAANELIRRLDRAPALYELTVNPLLLTMLAYVHHYRGALPGSRADLYNEICEAMLWRRQEAKDLDPQIPGLKKLEILRRLAFRMMDSGVRDLSKPEVVACVDEVLGKMRRKIRVDKFLDDVSSNGLLIERAVGVYSFSHLTFQEYLAASHVRENRLVSVLVDNVDNVWWRETTLLYTARSDADEVVQACLDSGSATALSLAFDCVDADEETLLDQELRDRLNELLLSAFAAETMPDQRRLMAAVLATRHLRQFVRVDQGKRICALPVSNRIYWLFLADSNRPAPDGFPAYGLLNDDVVTGVWSSDAVAFTSWLNTITGAQTTYELPTRRGIDKADLDQVKQWHSIWVRESDRAKEPVLWTGSDFGPYRITSYDLEKQIRKDVATHGPDLFRLQMICSVVELRLIVDELVTVARDYGASTHPHAEQARARLAGPSRQRAKDLSKALLGSSGLVVSDDLVEHRQALLRITDTIAHARASEWDPAMDRAHSIAKTLIRTMNPELVGAFALSEDVLGGADGSQIMGSALSQSFRRLLRNTVAPLVWTDALAEEFIRQAHVDGLEFDEAPDALAVNLQRVRQKVASALGEVDTSWAARGAAALHATAWAAATRNETVSASKAAAVRLAALSLATEDVSGEDARLRFACRAIAAGITVLERRARGDLPVTETIMLAPAH